MVFSIEHFQNVHTSIMTGGVDDGKNCDRIVLTLFLSFCDVTDWDLSSFDKLLSPKKKKCKYKYYSVKICIAIMYWQSSSASLSLSVVISLCVCGTDK